jgi:putative oxidoreductase
MLQSSRLIEFAPLPLRTIAGVGFMIHGLPKILDIGKTQGSFMNMGLPQDLAILIGLLEFIGGLAILLGIFTRIAAGLLAIQMIGAILLVKYRRDLLMGLN